MNEVSQIFISRYKTQGLINSKESYEYTHRNFTRSGYTNNSRENPRLVLAVYTKFIQTRQIYSASRDYIDSSCDDCYNIFRKYILDIGNRCENFNRFETPFSAECSLDLLVTNFFTWESFIFFRLWQTSLEFL